MRKIGLIGVFVMLLVGFWLVKAPPVDACVNWCPDPVCSTGEPIGACSGIYIHECCDEGGGSTWCPPNYYACNAPGEGTTCCEVGTGGGGGGGQRECWNGNVSCPAGYWADTRQV